LVEERGHIVNDYPLIIESKCEEISKTKEAMALLKSLGLGDELKRTEEKKVRAGKGKLRGRKYKTKVGPLFVVSKECKLIDAVKNIPGIDVEIVQNLNADLLAPGGKIGRATIYSEDSILRLQKEKLFMG
jgi:large subunit ribosomal protein L4e